MSTFTPWEQQVFDDREAATSRVRHLSHLIAEEVTKPHPCDVAALVKARDVTSRELDHLLAEERRILRNHGCDL